MFVENDYDYCSLQLYLTASANNNKITIKEKQHGLSDLV